MSDKRTTRENYPKFGERAELINRIAELERQLAEARAEIERLEKDRGEWIFAAGSYADKIEELDAERDQLRARNAELPKKIAFAIRGSKNTYAGGHRGAMLDAFWHGMDTAANVAEGYLDDDFRGRVHRAEGEQAEREAAEAALAAKEKTNE